MNELKNQWKNLTAAEKAMVLIRDIACFGMILVGLLHIFGILYSVSAAVVMLPLAAFAQGILSWKRSRATAGFFFGFLVFFLFMYFVSKG